MLGVYIEKRQTMVARGPGRIRSGSPKEKLPKSSTSLRHPTALTNSASSGTRTLPQRSPAGDLAPPAKLSGLDQFLKLIHPRTSKLSKAKLKIAPSGAIVFTPVESQDSLGSSTLQGKSFPSTYIDIGKLTNEHSRDSGCTICRLERRKTAVNACTRPCKSL